MKSILEDKVIQGLENYSYKEVTDLIKYFIIDRLYENNIIPNRDIKIIGIQLHGSRLRGQAKKRSDLDAVFQYDGDLREDDLFTLLNSRPQYRIEGIKVDINPIKEDIRSYMKRSDDYDQFKLGNKLEERINRLERLLTIHEDYCREK